MNLSLISLIFLLGLRHGIDWDHIAAITDVTSTSDNKKHALLVGSLYVLGHALMIVFLGIVAITVGARLPDWVDRLMEPLVGITLILLGAYVLYSVARFRHEYKLKSRWMVMFSLIRKLTDKLHSRLHHEERAHEVLHHPEKYDSKAAIGIGMIHGIGAETPTQILLFLTASNVQSPITGLMILFLFVAGLMISNSMITVLSILGFTTVKNNKALYVVFGFLTGILSLLLGTTYLMGRGSLLPAIFAG